MFYLVNSSINIYAGQFQGLTMERKQGARRLIPHMITSPVKNVRTFEVLYHINH